MGAGLERVVAAESQGEASVEIHHLVRNDIVLGLAGDNLRRSRSRGDNWPSQCIFSQHGVFLNLCGHM